jgi:hypothetical protein
MVWYWYYTPLTITPSTYEYYVPKHGRNLALSTDPKVCDVQQRSL